jgi:hypothetical protein
MVRSARAAAGAAAATLAVPVAAAVTALVAAPLLWSTAIAAAGTQAPPAALTLPEVPGWTKFPPLPDVRGSRISPGPISSALAITKMGKAGS